jgi:hypothetical protein
MELTRKQGAVEAQLMRHRGDARTPAVPLAQPLSKYSFMPRPYIKPSYI